MTRYRRFLTYSSENRFLAVRLCLLFAMGHYHGNEMLNAKRFALDSKGDHILASAILFWDIHVVVICVSILDRPLRRE